MRAVAMAYWLTPMANPVCTPLHPCPASAWLIMSRTTLGSRVEWHTVGYEPMNERNSSARRSPVLRSLL